MNSKEKYSLKLDEKADKFFKGKGFEIPYYSEEMFMKEVLASKIDLKYMGHIDLSKVADNFEKEELMQAYVPNSDVSFSYFTEEKKMKVEGYIQMGDTMYLSVVNKSQKLKVLTKGLFTVMLFIGAVMAAGYWF